MQVLNAAPRDAYTAAQITALLEGNVSVDFGADLLRPDLSFVSDFSADLVGGSVARNCRARIHGTCSLQLSRSLVWGVDLVRPYMVLTSGSVVARWNLGVYLLTTPSTPVGETPTTYDAQGYDRLSLLMRQIGADYSVAAGTTYRQALLDLFAAAGLTGVLIDGAAADNTLPTLRSWPLVADTVADPDQTTTPVTYLQVANDLLRSISFRAVWADENGTFRCSTYQDPKERAVEFTFSVDSAMSIVGEDRTILQDTWATPNRWVFRNTTRPTGAPAATEGDGILTIVNQSDGPTSIDQRGLTWTSVVDYEAATQAKLVELGNRRVASDMQTTLKVDVTTGPFPGAGHYDVFSYVDAAAGGTRKVQASSWSLPLDGGNMTWEWEQV